MKILVVDDDAMNRKYLRVLLMQEGHTVLEVEDGLEALHTLERENIDAVISDILMPRMDGYRLCYEIRKNPALNPIPFIAYTATYTSSLDKRVALDFGADRFVAKPAIPEVIIKALHDAVKTRGGRVKQFRKPDELLAMKEYSETLVRKLEETNDQLFEANDTLNERAVLAELNATISDALNHRGTLRVILQLCAEAMVQYLDAAFARIWTYNPDDYVLELQASAGMYTHLNGGHARVPVGQFKIGLIASERKPHLTNSAIGDPRVNDQEWAKREGMVSFAGYPLIVEERLVGVMAMFAKKPLSQNTLDAMASVANGIAAGIERKVTEDELRNSEERFRELAENIREIFYIAGPGGTPVDYVSPAFETITGHSRNGFEGNPGFWLDLIHPEDRDHVEQAHRSAPEKLASEYRMVRPDGSMRWIHSRSFPVRDDAGKTVRLVGIAEDISERKRAEQAAQRNFERIQALHEIDSAITSTLDLPAILNLLLEKLELFLPHDAATVRLYNATTHELHIVASRNTDEEDWTKYLSNPKHTQTPSWIVFDSKKPLAVRDLRKDSQIPDGGFIAQQGLVSFLGAPLIAKGEALGVITLYAKEEHDFTEEEIEFLSTVGGQAAIAIHNAGLYEQTKTQHRDLEKTNKVKSEFLNVMSHELRTPLNIIMGYSTLGQEEVSKVSDDERRTWFRTIESQARVLLSMVNSIMTATQLESRTVAVEQQWVDVDNLFEQLKSAYDFSKQKGLTLVWQPADCLPTLLTDQEKLQVILQNLISNALKFTESGSVTVSARLIDSSERNSGHDNSGSELKDLSAQEFIEFKISDTGQGIPEEELPGIFDLFQQVDSSASRAHEGIGLGLYIAKKYCELLGGEVSAESELGKGSTFTVRIPCDREKGKWMSRV